jgi:hypothetical protein
MEGKKQRQFITYNLREIGFAVWTRLAVIMSVFSGVKQPNSATSMAEDTIALVGHISREKARRGARGVATRR